MKHLPLDRRNIDDIRTIDKFNYAWQKFAFREVSLGWHKDSFSYMKLLPSSIFDSANMIGLDAGCGSGADLIYMRRKGIRMLGIDAADAVDIAYRNTRNTEGIDIFQADIYNLPFKESSFDLVYSLGVLHHLRNPEDAFKKLSKLVKSGGTIIIYVYEKFTNRSCLGKFGLWLTQQARGITTQLNPSLLYLICVIFSPLILMVFSLPAKFMLKFNTTRKIAYRLPYRHTANLLCIVADLYDRFSPPIENRYNRDRDVV